MSYQNRWRDGFICMLIVAAAAYYFDLRDLWRQYDDLENELNRTEIVASIKQPEAAQAFKIEVPPYLELLTRLLREYHLQLAEMSSPDDENYRIKVSGSYASLRQFISALTANAEFIINDAAFVSESEIVMRAELDMQFLSVAAAKKFRENMAPVQFANPFCSAFRAQNSTSFHRDDIGVLGTVHRGGETYTVVMYPDGVMKEIKK